MISKCIDYLEQNGYYGPANVYTVSEIAFKAAEQLCEEFTDKEGNEVPDDVFTVVWDLIKGEL